MKKRIGILIMIAILLIPAFLPEPVQAAEYSFDGQYITLEVGDDVLIMTPSTSKYDEVWQKAGVASPKDKLNEFKQMGVVAAFYDPSSGVTVSFICKHNSATVNVYSFAEKSDQDIIDYVSEGFSSNENLRTEISVIPHDTVNFFRLLLDASQSQDPSVQGIELIYGTAYNGMMLQFDCYSAGNVIPDEKFISSLVSSVKFTRYISREEYEAEAARSARNFFIGVGIFFGALILLIIYAIVRKRNNKKRLERVSEATSAFHEKRKNGEIPDDLPVRYTASCTYTEAAVNSYSTYNTWIKALPVLAPCGIFYLLIIFLMLDKGYPMYSLITAGVGIYLLYAHYSRLEKLKESMKKRLNTAAKPEVTIRFYDEFFDVTGLGAISEYSYLQITSLGHFNGYSYIYVGEDNCLFIDDKRIVPDGHAGLSDFIKSKRR
ncbi:MAG: hypothetical protein K6E85_11005 [Lachnospiraceae bacterium]|nr:hypothetical protein [Lachnospiraceae bacterium]